MQNTKKTRPQSIKDPSGRRNASPRLLPKAATGNRRANAERREVERQFETLATHAPVGIFINDVGGNCVYVNPRCCEILGLCAEDAWGQGLVNAIHPDDRDRELRAREQAMAANTVREAEYQFRRPDGHSVWVKTRSGPLGREGGKSVARIGTITDITELKRTEKSLRESKQRLQTLLDERERLTQDLHDGCIQSIYAIGLNLQSCRLLLDDHPEAGGIIGACAASLNLVIQELRSFINGHGTGMVAGRDLQREIEQAVQAGGNQGPAFAIDIDAAVADALARDVASHLLQIAREAISNATRHAHARSGRVSLRALDGFIRLEISDDGIGFNPQVLGKSGLGLHHIDVRARNLGGRSKIVSTPNNGTCIVVQIPVTR